MSLLDNGPHAVAVELATATDGYSGQVTYGQPIPVRCSVQPLTAEEAIGLGVTPVTSFKVITRSWPGGMLSRVTWNGRALFQRGETLRRSMSPRTAHDFAVLVSNVAEAK